MRGKPTKYPKTIEAKTREGQIARAFVESLGELVGLAKKDSGAALRRKAWQVIRRRVPGVTQAVVTRTFYKLGEYFEWRRACDAREKRRRKAKPG
jgi:hypothetical protein